MANVMGSNMTADSSPFDDYTYMWVRRFQIIVTPVICSVGFFANILAAVVFLTPKLKKKSCCLFLAAKCFSDMGFLLSLLVVWLYQVHVPAFSTQVVCQVTVYVSYVCGFLSVWFVVCITFENYIRVSLAGHVKAWCSPSKARRVIAIIVVLSLLIYSFSVWTTGIVVDAGKTKCIGLVEFEALMVAMSYTDTVLTLFIPMVLMTSLNTAICLATCRALKRRTRLLGSQPFDKAGSASTLQMKASKLLFAVSVIFLILHTPSHLIRIVMTIKQLWYHLVPTVTDVILHRIFEMLFHLNFSIHCGIYLIFGDNFRSIFKSLYCSCCRRYRNSRVMV
ncbi:B1 bradykinin receptor-like [Gigantopelta aegis]|uniref:B1 bradykinin receptor-like n=1 Tax=Gigantopelta aegis TaxID=1735272 RepID=UPI001B88A873|nr:B1 bradykinin receptor-like [Gigantopelta aegis]